MANEKKKRLMFPTRRRLIQVYAALLSNAHLKGFIKGDIYTGQLKNACVPGLNCYSCPGAVGACPLGALQNALASSDKKAPYFIFGIILLMGLIFGRTICGYLCPFGLIQDLLDKIRVPKLKKSRFTRFLTYIKYVILLIFVIGIPLYYALQSLPMPGFCKYICPAGTLEGAIGLLANPINEPKLSMLNILFTRKFIILVVILLACIFTYRPFCRFLCPLGAIYGLFSRISLLGVKVNNDKCINCGKCMAHCKMDIRHVGDHECIQCGSCIDECPVKAISYKLTKEKPVDESSSDIRKKLNKSVIIFWAAALILLISLLIFVNRPDPDKNTETDSVQTSAETTLSTEASSEEITNRASDTESEKDNNVSTCPESSEEVENSAEETISELSIIEESASEETEEASLIDNESEELSEIESFTEDTTPIGMNIGDRCPTFTSSLYFGDEVFDLAETLGKITVINFWATWCTPCCAELPYFQALYENYRDDVVVIALHSNLVTDDVTAYLEKFDYTFHFGLDETGEIISSLGGSTMLPMTVILDQKGHIVYNAVGSMTYEKLEDLILPLIEEDN